MPRREPPESLPSTLAEALVTVDEALAGGDAARALELADAAAKRWPGKAEVHHARGVALREMGKPDEALEALDASIDLAPSFADAWLDSAEALLDDLGDPAGAIDRLARARRHVDEPAVLADMELLRGMALASLEDYTGALQALEEAARLDPGLGDVHAERGAVLIELLRLEDAEKALRKAIELVPESGQAHHLLGFVLDYTGRREASLPFFRKAAEVDAEAFAEPVRVTEKEFDQLVEMAVAEIPEPFAGKLKNVEISTENYADKDFCRRHDCSPTVLGLYVGTPMTERGATEPRLPDRIILFQRSLENASRSREELVAEIATTVQHEVGHLLGFSEDELHEHGVG